MTWWTAVPALTPVAAWDANNFSGTLQDRVGTRHAAVGNVSLGLDTYQCIRGNSNLWPLAAALALPASCTIVGLVKVVSESILFYGSTSPNEYFFDQEANGIHYFYSGAGQNVGAPVAFNQWKFMAVVKRAGNFGLYINGAWQSEAGGLLNTLPAGIGGFGYQGNGSGYNLNPQEFFAAAGVWSGEATLLELQTLEAATRAGVPLVLPGSFSLAPTLSRFVTNSLALVPGTYPARAVDPRYGWKNVYLGGNGTIEGTTTIEDIPGSRQVRLFEKRSGLLVAQTWSSPTGQYEFPNIDSTREYFAVAHDYMRVYNAVISDMLVP